jgi:hypothetical protein
MNNPINISTSSRFKLTPEQSNEIYGRLKAVFNCLPENRVSTGNAKYKVAESQKAPLSDWFPAKAGK